MYSTAFRTTPTVRLGVLALFAVACLTFGPVAQASAATFDPVRIISNDNLRDYDSMSVKDIQAFLETQPGPLKDLVARDYDKVITLSKKVSNKNITLDKGEERKPASRIIWEACQAWKINPKVMLTMLQKEQSLLTTDRGGTQLARAIGAGCPGGLVYPDKKSANYNPVATNRYPGFGNQIWHGARLLDGYGEGKNGSTIPLFYAGIYRSIYKIDGKTKVYPSNLATYKLYVYNPSIGVTKPYDNVENRPCSGNANFWKIYRKYFGSTYSDPRMRRVFRFRNRSNGSYYYTTSVSKRYDLASKHKRTWAYGGTAFSVDTSVPTTATIPVYRFKNKSTGKYSLTRDPEKYAARRTKAGSKTWAYGGIAFRVNGRASVGSVPIHRIHNKKTGADLFASAGMAAKLTKTATLRKTWRDEGVSFHLPRVSER